MLNKIFELRKDHLYEDEKIKISYSLRSVSGVISVYLKDNNGKMHHVFWGINPDRCNQNFDKTNEKIKVFVAEKIKEWEEEERIVAEKIKEWEEEERIEKERREQEKKAAKGREDNSLQSLMNSFFTLK